jgi:hypothetical protein
MIINDSAAQSLVKIGSPQKLQITDKITSNRIIYSSKRYDKSAQTNEMKV